LTRVLGLLDTQRVDLRAEHASAAIALRQVEACGVFCVKMLAEQQTSFPWIHKHIPDFVRCGDDRLSGRQKMGCHD
jgi:hypothetical protein